MSRADSTAALSALGFTALEAEVYSVLVEHAPTTAYRVAQELGKAAANVYKAVESLERKGAVFVEDSETRLCRAVSPSELLSALEREFRDAKTRATDALSKLGQSAGDDRVYHLRSGAQVLERARAMLGRTEHTALCDLFPEAVDALRPDLETAARRGARVCVQVYRPTEIRGAVEVYVKPDGQRLLDVWTGQWLNVVSDAREHLLALLHPGLAEVHQAVWSESVYLSILHFSGFAMEIVAGAASEALRDPRVPVDVRDGFEAVKASMRGAGLPGYAALVERFAVTRAPTAAATAPSKGEPRRSPAPSPPRGDARPPTKKKSKRA